MPVGTVLSNELYYYTEEVARYLSAIPKIQWEIQSTLERYFNAPSNQRKRNVSMILRHQRY